MTASPILRPRMPELDTLRGIAVLMVLFFHGFNGAPFPLLPLPKAARAFISLTAGGWAGVNLFFVLSGFLITGILLDSRTSPVYYRKFYWRRILRILPAYYLILLVLLAVTRMGLVYRRAGWPFLGLSAIYLANLTELFGAPSQYTVLWSLAVEEHYYLLWPTAVRFFSRRGLLIASLCLIVGCPLLRTYYFFQHYQFGAGYTWLVADGLACGSLLAILTRTTLTSVKRLAWFAFGVAALAAFIFAAGLPHGIYLSRTLAGGAFRHTFLNTAFTALIAATLAIGSTRFAHFVCVSWFRFVGEISYGFYLVHMLAFDVVDHFGSLHLPAIYGSPQTFTTLVLRFAAGALLAGTLAYLSRWYFEEQFLRLKDKPFRRIRSADSEEGRPL